MVQNSGVSAEGDTTEHRGLHFIGMVAGHVIWPVCGAPAEGTGEERMGILQCR